MSNRINALNKIVNTDSELICLCPNFLPLTFRLVKSALKRSSNSYVSALIIFGALNVDQFEKSRLLSNHYSPFSEPLTLLKRLDGVAS